MLFQSIKNTICKGALSLVCLTFTVSCESFIEIDPPASDLTVDVVFADPKTVEATVTGLYSSAFISGNFWHYAPHFYGGMIADEIYARTATVFDDLRYNTYNPNIATYGLFWSNGYKIIYQANSIINGLEKNTVVSEALKQRYTAEAKFIRAYMYMLITGYYGDVPLILTTTMSETSVAPRTPKAEVMAQVIKDIQEAETVLATVAMPTTKVNKLAASALLARVYLYERNWDLAIQKATEVLAGSAKLESDLNKVFLRTSTEAIWKISSQNSNPSLIDRTSYAQMIVPSETGLPTYPNYTSLYRSFENGDKRKEKWIGYRISGTDTLTFSNKYKQRATPADASLAEDAIILRLGEQYLIRAEANIQKGNLKEAVADINVLRKRAELPNLPETMTQAQMILQIEKERRAELFVEGHRWFDITRTGRADAVFGAEKPTWKPHAALLPISRADMESNPKLIQNPGYN